MSKKLNNTQIKLINHTFDQKARFNLCKLGKRWVVAGAILASFSLGGLMMQGTAHADTTANNGVIDQISPLASSSVVGLASVTTKQTTAVELTATQSTNQQQTDTKTLPQTGEARSNMLSVLIVELVALLGLFGLAAGQRKRGNK